MEGSRTLPAKRCWPPIGFSAAWLVAALRPGDAVILDNLSRHKSPKAAKMLGDVGARFLFPPPHRPNLNPVEMAFAKLNALIRKAAPRTYGGLWLPPARSAASTRRMDAGSISKPQVIRQVKSSVL